MNIRRIAPKLAQKKVAAYARVSTLSEEQEESYETQVKYYTSMIEATEGWGFVGIYADHGITGTSAAKRPQFLRMLEDARDGKMNLILCKSISRFSRNFAEAEKYVHELKSINVEIRFEKEGISSFDPGSDLIFSLMAAMAQEESRSISENVKWSYRRLAEKGIRHVGNHRMLGYKEVNGKLTPNNDAWIVRMIFEEYAADESISQIIQHLNDAGAKRMRSGRAFDGSAISAILRNEAYVGDRLIQKTASQNYLSKKPDLTEPYDSHFIRDDHEAIVSREVWDQVQNRLKQEKEERDRGLFADHRSHFLYGKVFCAECGEPYRRYTAQVVSGTHKVWRCRGRVNKNGCRNKQVDEEVMLSEIRNALGIESDNSDGDVQVRDCRIMVSKQGITVEKQMVEETA